MKYDSKEAKKHYDEWARLQFNDAQNTEPIRYADEYTANHPAQSINVQSLISIAIYFEGVKFGKGDIHPLGNNDLQELWKAIYFLKNNQP
jgi:hypothetical protein